MSDVDPLDAPPTDPTPTDPPDTPDPAAEVARLRDELAKARKWEERAKANSKAADELDRLRRESMTEVERAVTEAKTQARAEALREVGTRLVDAEVRAATVGRGIDVKALLDGLDRSRFLDDDGQPDTDRIAKWVDKIAPPDAARVPPGRPGPRSTADQGRDMNTLIRRAARGGA